MALVGGGGEGRGEDGGVGVGVDAVACFFVVACRS